MGMQRHWEGGWWGRRHDHKHVAAKAMPSMVRALMQPALEPAPPPRRPAPPRAPVGRLPSPCSSAKREPRGSHANCWIFSLLLGSSSMSMGMSFSLRWGNKGNRVDTFSLAGGSAAAARPPGGQALHATSAQADPNGRASPQVRTSSHNRQPVRWLTGWRRARSWWWCSSWSSSTCPPAEGQWGMGGHSKHSPAVIGGSDEGAQGAGQAPNCPINCRPQPAGRN